MDVEWGIFVSFTSKGVVEVIIVVIAISDCGTTFEVVHFGCQCRSLQTVITLMDVSDAQLISGKLLWRHVL